MSPTRLRIVVDNAPAAVSEAALGPRQHGGRPMGSASPLSRWLRPQIEKFKRQGASCRNVFLALSTVEGGDDEKFEISDETADSMRYELGTSIAGQVVTYQAFRKAWQRLKLF